MDLPTVAVSAVVGAAVALGTALIRDHLKEANANAQTALERGYYQGRESVLQSFQANVEPQDFTRTR